MPRAFDSDDVARDQAPVAFVETVDCPHCAEAFPGRFDTDADTVDDVDAPPQAEHTCPRCGNRFTAEFTGWTFYTEAG